MTRIRAWLRSLALTDRLAIVGVALIFAGAWTIWWQAAIILLGATLLTIAIGLALLGRKGAAGTGRHEG